MLLTNINIHALELHRQTWAEQIKTAMTVNGGDLNNATTLTYVLHFFSFFWKVIFAFIPPAAVFSGWLRFVTSLTLIGVMATIIGDLATIFGCLIGLDDAVTGNLLQCNDNLCLLNQKFYTSIQISNYSNNNSSSWYVPTRYFGSLYGY